MVQEGICSLEGIVKNFLPFAEGMVKGYCMYRFMAPFMAPMDKVDRICPEDMGASSPKARKLPSALFGASRNKGAAIGSAAYFFTMALFYALGLSFDYYVVYGMASLAMYLVICQADKRNYRQKAFLVATFFSLNLFAASMAEILYDFLYGFMLDLDYFRSHPSLSPALFIAMCGCDLAMEFGFTAIGLWQAQRVYTGKGEEMGKKELALLALPSCMGVIGYEIMRYYRVFYALKVGKMERAYDSLTFLFCIVSSVTIITVVMLYQDIKAKQEERQQAKFLAVQVSSIQRHIEQVEALYHNIRSIKHDMANHILTLERLYEVGDIGEAEAYSKGLKAELAQMAGGIGSGNPVTDVILQEFAKEAGDKGIAFHSEFHYPAGFQADAFDISIILNNALQNAVEHTKPGAGRQISIVSYQRNHAYMIEICNSFAGELEWDVESGLPATSKEKAAGHGYGLPNIRRVAGKYAGDIDITLQDGSFCLCIMLMME